MGLALERPLFFAEQPGHSIAGVGQFLVLFWRQAPTNAAVDDVEVALRRCAAKRQGMHIAAILEQTPGLPEDPVRQRLMRSVEKYDSEIRSMGVAVEVDGLAGMLARTVVRGMFLARRLPYPTHCAESAAALADWFATRAGVADSPADIVAAFDAIRGARDRYPAEPAA